jgi:hypothetical protein
VLHQIDSALHSARVLLTGESSHPPEAPPGDVPMGRETYHRGGGWTSEHEELANAARRRITYVALWSVPPPE